MIKNNKFFVDWMGGSILDMLELCFPKKSKTALITCLDSNTQLNSREIKESISNVGLEFETIGQSLLVKTKDLTLDIIDEIFFGYDEIWFLKNEVKSLPLISIVGPNKITQSDFDKLYPWLEENDCICGLGDGDGINIIGQIIKVKNKYGKANQY